MSHDCQSKIGPYFPNFSYFGDFLSPNHSKNFPNVKEKVAFQTQIKSLCFIMHIDFINIFYTVYFIIVKKPLV